MAPRIDMLGTGNAFLPHGRHHSFAMFDERHIIDAPPTALAGLRRHGKNVAEIETVFITHVHGDHVFGFPLLLLERKYISDRTGTARSRSSAHRLSNSDSLNCATWRFRGRLRA